MFIRNKKDLVKYIRYFPDTGEFNTIAKGVTIRKDYVKINNTHYLLINVASMIMTGEWNVRNIFYITEKYNYIWTNLKIGKDYNDFKITGENIRDYLFYHSISGIFYWNKTLSKFRNEMDIAGYVDSNGYIIISINGDYNSGERLAVLYMTGSWPAKGMVVDHINEDNGDNSWNNLRVVTQGQNIKYAIENYRKRIKERSNGI